MRFENQVALVTGAASGIGRSLVKQLAAEGASVVAVDMSEEALHKVVAEIQAHGGKAIACVSNVAVQADVERMLNTAITAYGRLDILCNNAGIMDLMTPAADVPLDLWDRVIAVNLTGPFLACRLAIPLMLAHGGGKIVNTASEAGLRGGCAGTAYTASKHGVVGLTKSIAFHYADQGIRCNAVCPGGVETAIGVGGKIPHGAGLAKVMALVANSGGTTVAKPEQIASVIAFLASDEASNVNGAIIPVDNGWAAS
jgi:NAD(P)-dependent dehydrogenase (short-subunit alcohol dehydrogenase family)